MKSEGLKNQCQKRTFFWHRLFRVLTSIWEGLWPPSWSQIDRLGLPRPSPKPPKSRLLGACVPRCFPKGSKVGPQGILRKAQKSFFGRFSIDLGFFCYFWLWKSILCSTKTSGIICNVTCWVTPWLAKYMLTDVKPHGAKESQRHVRSTKNLIGTRNND